MKKQIIHLCGWMVAAAALLGGGHARGLTFNTLHVFQPEPPANPIGLIQGSDGNFYGISASGGINNCGTVFKITASGSLITLYSFPGNVNPPNGLVQGSDGNLYGTTMGGEDNGYLGTVFRITLSGYFTTLYSFTGGNDGGNPQGGLVQGKDSNIYGTTYSTIFRITSSGSLTTLYSFSAVSNSGTNADGVSPNGVIQGNDGNFYGTAKEGGANGCGTIFEITSSGSLTTLYSFSALSAQSIPGGSGTNTDGAYPAGLVQGSDGNFYGTTLTGGSSAAGTVFKITAAGSFTTLSNLTSNADGVFVNGFTRGGDGNFYGTMQRGGSYGDGTVFQMTLSGSINTLYSFGELSNGTNADGATPTALIQGSDGNLYGTTENGGDIMPGGMGGTVFKITTSGSLTTLSYLSSNGDGASPNGLVQGSDGNFYGTTEYGGVNIMPGGMGVGGFGTVFRMSPGGSLTTLYLFGAVANDGNDGGGAQPTAGLVQGSDGNLYGTTSESSGGCGTVFKITTSGSLTTLYSFSALGYLNADGAPGINTDGAYPGGLVQGGDGNFYGTTQLGGSSGDGTLFQMTSIGSLTSLYSFSALSNGTNADGATPAALIQGRDGNLYGTTQSGGVWHFGTVFQVKSSGSLTTLHSFTGGNDGANPQGALIQGTDGNFYGTSSRGGSAYYGGGSGTVFKITTSGSLTTLHSFSVVSNSGTNADGAYPNGLIQGNDGNFYGTAGGGGINGCGTIFEITSSGSLTTLYSFTGYNDGMNPNNLVQGSDGGFFGTTSALPNADISDGAGTVFELIVAPTYPVSTAVVSATSVTFSASVNPQGFAGPSTNKINVLVSWQYGLAAGSYAIGSTTAQPIGTGTTAVPVTFTLAKGRITSAIYHYRLVISSTLGYTYGPDQTFSFEPPTLTYPTPPVTTGTGAVLSPTVNPNGLDTTVSIQYGLTSACASGTISIGDIGSGFAPVTMSGTLNGLAPDTAYYYRVVTTNVLGTVNGPAQIFDTQPAFLTTVVASKSGTAPGISGASFSVFGNPVMNDLGHTAFQATVTGSAGSGVTAANNSGIWADSGTNGLTLIARTGTPAPGYAPGSSVGTFATLSDPVYADSDAVAFLGTLAVSGTVTTSNKTGIWATTSGTTTGPLVLVARAGDLAPDKNGAISPTGPKFASFSQFVLPDQGGVVILGTLVNGAAGVLTSNNTGIWAVNTSGVLTQIIRTGDALTVNGSVKTVSALAIFNAPPASTGQTRHFNNPGDLIYKATFTDSTSGFVESVFP